MRRRKFQKAIARKKREARESAACALQNTKAGLGIGTAGPLKGAISSSFGCSCPAKNAENGANL